MKCKISGCGRMVGTRKDVCDAHYFRMWRTGSYGTPQIWNKKPGRCAVRGCRRRLAGGGHCQLHGRRVNKGGSPDFVGNQAWDNNPAWKGNHVGYTAAHERVASRRGQATDHICACGKPAKHWAYTHRDPKELRTKNGTPYSADADYYVARCVPCHKVADLKRRRSTPR